MVKIIFIRSALVFVGMYVFCMAAESFVQMGAPTWSLVDWSRQGRFIFFLMWAMWSFVWCLHFWAMEEE